MTSADRQGVTSFIWVSHTSTFHPATPQLGRDKNVCPKVPNGIKALRATLPKRILKHAFSEVKVLVKIMSQLAMAIIDYNELYGKKARGEVKKPCSISCWFAGNERILSFFFFLDIKIY
jgi:hypothetical protein